MIQPWHLLADSLFHINEQNIFYKMSLPWGGDEVMKRVSPIICALCFVLRIRLVNANLS